MTSTTEAPPSLEDRIGVWALVEVMGRRSHAGKISEEQVAGKLFLRVDALVRIMVGPDNTFEWEMHLYHPDSIFSLTPCDEDRARANATRRYPPHPLGELHGSYDIDDDDDHWDDES